MTAGHETADRLAAIRAVAERDGVHVAVDVHGALVDLRIAEQAMRQAPRQLADRITDLVAEATRTATAEGLALVYWAGGPALAAHLAVVGTDEPSEPDTFEPATWAV